MAVVKVNPIEEVGLNQSLITKEELEEIKQRKIAEVLEEHEKSTQYLMHKYSKEEFIFENTLVEILVEAKEQIFFAICLINRLLKTWPDYPDGKQKISDLYEALSGIKRVLEEE